MESFSTDPSLVVSHKFPETLFSYTERDVVLYALGIGSCGKDAIDEKELQHVYHEDGQHHVKVLPTFVTLFPHLASLAIKDVPDLQFDPLLLLHGQQYIEIYKTLPTNCCVQNKQVVAGFHDKGKAAIIELETTSYEKESGEPLCMNRCTIYLRGAGGFSKSSKPYSYSNYPKEQVSSVRIPKCEPSAIYEDCTQKNQALESAQQIQRASLLPLGSVKAFIDILALLYRLSGDYNPLHSDPVVGKIAGFERPILHGLCSLGFAVRAVINVFCKGEPSSVKVIFGRFLRHVYPGETLITEMWLSGSRVIYQMKVKERSSVVLNGYVGLRIIPSSL